MLTPSRLAVYPTTNGGWVRIYRALPHERPDVWWQPNDDDAQEELVGCDVFPLNLVKALGNLYADFVLYMATLNVAVCPYVPKDVLRQSVMAAKADAMQWRDDY